MAKNVQIMAHEFTIIHNEVHILQNMNTALAKYQKTKKTHLQKKRALSREDSKVLLTRKKKKNIQRQLMMKMLVHQRRVK